ncbi:hypothetical protein PoB_003561800 [Plakobranchus ocellatus]|uniref:Uncharacterized protein n=1 Tax=Plakobranchus ocellatus TaxID=259542 RepID=A0AAV4AP31_9GAST|nr:hypothetical protein PoB_003561800 [Plakobranchus ocellatus]
MLFSSLKTSSFHAFVERVWSKFCAFFRGIWTGSLLNAIMNSDESDTEVGGHVIQDAESSDFTSDKETESAKSSISYESNDQSEAVGIDLHPAMNIVDARPRPRPRPVGHGRGCCTTEPD